MDAATGPIVVGGLESRRFSGALEGALLFAAGHAAAARACLDDLLQENVSDPRAWTPLLDIHRLLGERDCFDALMSSYREVFPRAPAPSWDCGPIPRGPGVITLCGVLARSADLQALQVPHGHHIVAIDLGRLERLAFGLTPVFCSALHRAAAMGKRVILANVCELHELLLREVGLPPQVTVLPQRPAAAYEGSVAAAA